MFDGEGLSLQVPLLKKYLNLQKIVVVTPQLDFILAGYVFIELGKFLNIQIRKGTFDTKI